MKVTIRDKEILKTVNPKVLEEHLIAKGWYEHGRIYNNAGAIWRLKQDAEDEFEILLPLSQTIGDYAARISDAIKILEEVENRSQLDILSKLITTAPNSCIQGVVMQIDSPNSDQLSGQFSLLGVVIDKLQRIQTELFDRDYILAIKAYQERLPVLCWGDLIKENNTFILKNSHNFTINQIC